MNILVTGGTGFIGKNLVPALLARGHNLTLISRSASKVKAFSWASSVNIIESDLSSVISETLNGHNFDSLLHLAWSNLPNYQNTIHISEGLPGDLKFLSLAIKEKIPQIIVTGTCLEYGMQSGELKEEQPTIPNTPYGYAKDVVRKSLEYMKVEYDFTLKWIRLFYIYGNNQRESTLFGQLDSAIDKGETVFNMSMGKQLRDYSSIENIVRYLCAIVESNNIEGVINCCSGKPISVEALVEARCEEKGSTITLNKGFYKIPNYEPIEFWGSNSKLKSILDF